MLKNHLVSFSGLSPGFCKSFGPFVPAFGQSFSVSGGVSFLNDTNSGIFFEAATASVLNIVTVMVTHTPEPSALALLAVGGVVTPHLSRLPRWSREGWSPDWRLSEKIGIGRR
jgi:hypothetical protein